MLMPRQVLYLHGDTISNAIWARTLNMLSHKGCTQMFFRQPNYHYLYSIHRYVWTVHRDNSSRRLLLLTKNSNFNF